MVREDRAMIADLVGSVENFNPAEKDCALELIDIYLDREDQTDYRVGVAEDSASKVLGYACWGAVPLTQGTYDLYWIATHPVARGCGFGHALMEYVEQDLRKLGGRLLVAETSGKKSYQETINFYHRLDFQEASRIKDFYDVGDDRLIFIKRIT